MIRKKIKDLVFDENLLELRPVNLFVVSRYRQAMRGGDIFPPVLIDKKTSKIISGNHRVTAFEQEFGKEHEIDVLEKKFESEIDVLKTFATENAKHGNPLSGFSQTSITQKLLTLGCAPEEISRVLNIPVQKIQKIGDKFFVVVGKNKAKEYMPMKNGLSHLAGTVVTREAYVEHKEYDRGVPAKSLAQQLTRWIRNNWINEEDDTTMLALEELHTALVGMLKKKAA